MPKALRRRASAAEERKASNSSGRSNDAAVESIEAKLKEELSRLQDLFELGRDLKVVFRRSGDCRGEVKGRTVLVYADSLEKALHILKHEFVEYVLMLYLVYPHLSRSEDAYEFRELVVEKVAKLAGRASASSLCTSRC
jgi:hypothetical protein